MPRRFFKLSVLEIVMIAVILFVLGTILWPITTHHGEPAARTLCLSNLKQQSLAMIMYATDWDDRFPDRDAWMDLDWPYHKMRDIEHCPAVSTEFDKNPSLYGYAFNSRLSRVSAAKLENPAETYMLYDSVNLARNASDPLLSLPSPPRKHGRRANQVAYADGHARTLSVLDKSK